MDSEEKLICLVQKYECLYDINCKSYCDKQSKQNAWEKISKDMGIPGKKNYLTVMNYFYLYI